MMRSMTAFGRAKREGAEKDITIEIKSVNSRFFDCNVKLPRAYNFIEERIKLLSKQYKDPELIKGTIIFIVFIVLTIGWVVVGQYLSRKVYFETPESLIVSNVEENKVTLSWDSVMYAKEYSIYYVVDGNTSSTYYSEKCEFTFTLEDNKTYTFYVYVQANDLFGKSNEATVTYTLNNTNE